MNAGLDVEFKRLICCQNTDKTTGVVFRVFGDAVLIVE